MVGVARARDNRTDMAAENHHHDDSYVSIPTSVEEPGTPQSIDVIKMTVGSDPYVNVVGVGSNTVIGVGCIYGGVSRAASSSHSDSFPVSPVLSGSFSEDCTQPLLEQRFPTLPSFSRNGVNGVINGVNGVNGGVDWVSDVDEQICCATSFFRYLRDVFCSMLLGSKLNVLLLFLPVAFYANAKQMDRGWIFAFSLLPLAPLAERLSFITEQIALSTNPMVGGLLNATFSNAPELILSIVALKAGLFRVVQLSLLGSVLGNMLLCLGSAFFAGGIMHKEQKFNGTACMTNTGLLMLGALSTLFPHVLHATHTEAEMDVSELQLSRVCAVVMLIGYLSYITFQLITHVDLYNDEEDGEEATIGLWGSLPWLALITGCISVLSDLLVDTMAAAAKSWGVPAAYLCVILLPIFNNVAEHGSAVLFGVKNKLDLALGIAVGSSIQIWMFLMPLCVVAGWICGKPMDLNFHNFESTILFAVILVCAIMLSDGKSNWLKGLVLILCYSIVAAAFFFHTDKYLITKPIHVGLLGQLKLDL
ncbi:hypothetical protein CBR_g46889 [Chara braunii]|uniref:Vacuolar cation/proton exchanger n=1 Tax=Chara braunii TaxID=69332 RepID=A0A388M1G2_CHABU|nr:hypothetical protein CBR_g46889 [Chara braunii]|eukprot:GBG88322.1 hypothetical protein CBR_g46889 [Chara braunii]